MTLVNDYPTTRLADFITDLSFDDIPNEVVEKIAKHFKINIKSTNSRIDPFAKKVISEISVVRKNEWLKNPPQKERFAITPAGKAIVDSTLL